MFEYFQFDTTSNLLMGLIGGIAFGFLLQRGGVTRFRTILGQFLWADHTVLRVMLTAVVVGAAGVWVMHQAWAVPLHIKSATLAANVTGGVLFGVGMALLGYCPGTGIAALGDGSRHAIPGVLGMLAGAAGYAEIYPLIKGNLLKAVDVTVTAGDKTTDKITFADLTDMSVWVYWIGLVVIAVVVFALLRNRDTARPAI
jgi:hypothetical protein